jgi:hypothetical protein
MYGLQSLGQVTVLNDGSYICIADADADSAWLRIYFFDPTGRRLAVAKDLVLASTKSCFWIVRCQILEHADPLSPRRLLCKRCDRPRVSYVPNRHKQRFRGPGQSRLLRVAGTTTGAGYVDEYELFAGASRGGE